MEFVEVTGKTVEEAINKGCAELNKTQEEVIVEVLEQPSSGFLGFGKKEARVKLSVKAVEEVVTEAVLPKVEPEAVVSKVEEAAEVVEEAVEEVEEITAPALSSEDQALIAEQGRNFLYSVFEKMNLKVMIEKRVSADKITFQVHGDDLGILIGKRGQTLDSLQYLTNLVANKGVAGRCHIVVDVENYRSRREETLVQLAKRLGDKVRRTRHRVVLEPMNAYERKIIHVTLQNAPHVSTDSEGEGIYRHVVINYVK